MELDATQELVRVFRKDGEIVAMEFQNGHIERYKCEPMTNSDSNELFGILSTR